MSHKQYCQNCGRWSPDTGPRQTTGTCGLWQIYTWPDAGYDCPEWRPRRSQPAQDDADQGQSDAPAV
jgi:hypothetical protein